MKLSEQGYSLLIALELGNDFSSLSYVQIDAQGNITAVKNHDVGDGGTTIGVGIYVKASDMNRIQMLYNLEIDWTDLNQWVSIDKISMAYNRPDLLKEGGATYTMLETGNNNRKDWRDAILKEYQGLSNWGTYGNGWTARLDDLLELYFDKDYRKDYQNGMSKIFRLKKILLLNLLVIILNVNGCMYSDGNITGRKTGIVPGIDNYGIIIPEESEFVELIKDNPIDKMLKWEDGGSEKRISFAVKYRDLWLIEIENTKEILKGYLPEQEYDLLDKSYKNWKEYINNMTNLEQNLFYPGFPAGSEITYPKVMEVCANKTREYAVELMSLEFALTGNVEFIYQE